MSREPTPPSPGYSPAADAAENTGADPTALRRQVASGLRWTTFARFGAQMFSWASTILVIRYLDQADYGVIAMAQVVYSILLSLSSYGLADGLIQRKDTNSHQQRWIFTVLIMVNFSFAALQWIAAPWIADYFKEPLVTDVARALCFGLVLLPIITINVVLLKREMNFRTLALTELTAAVIGSAVTLITAIYGHGVWALVYGQLVNVSVRAVALPIVRGDWFWPTLKPAQTDGMLKFGFWVALSSVGWDMLSMTDRIVAGRQVSTAELGVYAAALSLASLPMVKLMPLLKQVALPSYSQIQSDPPRMVSYFLKTQRMAAVLAFPAFFGMAAVAEPLTLLLLGEKWHAVAIPLAILCLSMPLRMSAGFYESPLDGVGRSDVPIAEYIFSMLTLALGFYVLAKYGPQGMALVWVLAYPIIWLFAHFNARRALPFKLADTLAAVAPGTLCSAVMGAAVAATAQLLMPHLHSALVLLICIPLGAAIYAALVRLFIYQQLKEAIAVFRS